MAWVFSLSAECGTKQSEAQQFAQYFNLREFLGKVRPLDKVAA